jgi:hypothetical protein
MVGLASLGQFGRSVSWRHCQTHHVGECSGVVISDLPDQLCDLRRQDRLAGDDLGQRRQSSFMITSGNPIEDEPVPEAAGEPHPNPSAGHCFSVLLSRHRIVERAVQVAERDIDSHPGNRKFGLARFGHTR